MKDAQILGWLFGGRKKWNTQLHAAVQAGDITGVRDALDKGADIDVLDDVRGEIAVHTSVAMENKGLIGTQSVATSVLLQSKLWRIM